MTTAGDSIQASPAGEAPAPRAAETATEGTLGPGQEAQLLITARQAYPAFERAVIGARKRIDMGFRIIDLRTRLRSEEGKRIGETWADLLADALCRGVDIRLVVADFDPIGGPELHRGTWRTVRQCAGLGELADTPGAGKIEVIASRHPARIGSVPSAFLWLVAAGKLRQAVRLVNGLKPGERSRFLTEVPRLLPHLLVGKPDDPVRPRWLRRFRMTPVTHHQKLAVIDDEVLYIGGLDLDERRWDTPRHDLPARLTWHDIQMLFREPELAAQARRHLDNFVKQTGGEDLPPEGRSTDRPVVPGLRFLTTLSAPAQYSVFRFGPENRSNGLFAAHVARARATRRLIYLESQFFRDRRMARALARAGRENPDLNLLLVLPAAPEEVAFASGGSDARYGEFLQARSLFRLRRAFGSRFFVASPAQHRRPGDAAVEAGEEALGSEDGTGRENGGIGRAALCGAPLIYVHAKLAIFDEAAAIVSSANLNGRSLWWDTEAGVEVTRPGMVSEMREQVLSHWFPEARGPERDKLLDPQTALAQWRRAAVQDCRRAPEDRQGFLLPYDMGPGRRFGFPVPPVPEEMV